MRRVTPPDAGLHDWLRVEPRPAFAQTQPPAARRALPPKDWDGDFNKPSLAIALESQASKNRMQELRAELALRNQRMKTHADDQHHS